MTDGCKLGSALMTLGLMAILILTVVSHPINARQAGKTPQESGKSAN